MNKTRLKRFCGQGLSQNRMPCKISRSKHGQKFLPVEQPAKQGAMDQPQKVRQKSISRIWSWLFLKSSTEASQKFKTLLRSNWEDKRLNSSKTCLGPTEWFQRQRPQKSWEKSNLQKRRPPRKPGSLTWSTIEQTDMASPIYAPKSNRRMIRSLDKTCTNLGPTMAQRLAKKRGGLSRQG